MKYTLRSMTLVLMAVLITSCAGAPKSGNQDQPATATAVASEIPAASPTIAPTEIPVEPFLSAPGVANLNLLTDIENAGNQPLLQWEAMSGAERYQLIVFDEAGEPYWAWEGTKTQIYMGGTQEQPPADSSGPSINSGYTWAVVAYDADGKLLATSEVRSISP
jgi:hypothetical protein